MSTNKELRKAVQERRKDEGTAEGDGKFVRFTAKNSKYIIGVFAAIIIAILAGKLVMDRNAKKLEEAEIAFHRSESFYNDGDFLTALNGSSEFTVRDNPVLGFKAIAEKYSGTPTGKTSAYKAGLCYLKIDTPDEAAARKYFTKATKSESKPVLTGAYANIAALDEKDGNYEAAAKGFMKASEFALDEETKGRYTLFAALAFENAGMTKEAGETFRKIVSSYDKTRYVADAKTGLVRLGTKIE